MAVSPTGIISTRLSTLETMLSDSTAFQSFVGAADSTAALDSIYVTSPSVTGAATGSRPYAIVYLGAGFTQERNNFGRNTLKILLEKDVSATNQDNAKDAFYSFANEVGAIWSDLDSDRYEGGKLQIETITLDGEIQRANTREYDSGGSDDYFQVILDVAIGLR